MMTSHHTIKGYLLALMAVFFWSLNVLFAQRFSASITPLEFAFGRWFFALLILLPIGIKGVFRHRSYFLHHWQWIIWLALSGIVLDNTLIYLAAHTLDAVTLSLLNLLGPIFLVIISALFLKQTIGLGVLSGLLTALFGVILIITQGHLLTLTHIKSADGNIWMILNALCFALYSFLQYRRPTFISQTALLTITVLIGVLILAPIYMASQIGQPLHFSLSHLGVFIYLGSFNSVLAYLAWNSALHLIGPLKTGTIYYLQPLFSIIGAYFVLSTPVDSFQLIGGAIVIAGVLIVNHFHDMKKAG